MNLALDIGNSNTKWGLFEGDSLITKGVFSHLQNYPKYWDQTTIQAVVYCASGKISKSLSDYFFKKIEKLDIQEIPLPFESDYETPATLGKDRVAAIVGGKFLFPEDDLLIIDAGTCITYDFVNIEGIHKGGTISPGLNMRYNAMHKFTDKLPLIHSAPKKGNPLSVNTTEAVSQGGLLGYLYEIEGYLGYYTHYYPKVKILVTGGDASKFVKSIKIQIFAEPNLVLKGLNEILKNYAAEKGWN